MSVNKAILLGNVGKDPEVRTLQDGNTVANFTLATSERYKDRNGETRETTEWHTIVCWRGAAELAEKYVRKGSQLYVEGKIRSRSYEDANGQTRSKTEIIAETLQFLGQKPQDDTRVSQPKAMPKPQPKPRQIEDVSDDLPF